ncbi:hypothetical protein P7K49_035354 [Saguinus oedipus]|uniref:EF-hand domain-containing protein n=1 Tax=Saguinus oedipus TaxID=9490 RepID=A0ABQ9TML8_SAGOE|nr:hypothetical protein P7K49_035354 [Saguinus oedipus]
MLGVNLIEEEEPTGYIRFEKFLPVLDTAKRGFLTKDELIKCMTEEGRLILVALPSVQS